MSWNSQFFSQLPSFAAGAGLKTPFGMLLPPGGNVAAYVRSTGVQDYDESAIKSRLVPTLAQGLNKCRAGLGDTVVVLPGHSESVVDATMLDNLRSGCNIVGVGRGSKMPVFRWTATAAKWIINDADVVFSGLRLRLEGANGVVKAIEVLAADCAIYGCDIEVGSGASNKATIALEVGTGADRFELIGNILRGSIAGAVTDGVKVVAAVNDIRITDNEMEFAAQTTVGNIHFTAAALGARVLRNILHNSVAGSIHNITGDAVATTGVISDNRCSVLVGTATAPAATGVVLAAGSLFRCLENYSTPTAATSGLLTPAADV